jgi:glycosyltransferase involved in cell wall biosynthesis
MPYAMTEVELTNPLPGVRLEREMDGLAVLVRYCGRPIDFWMEAMPAGGMLTPEDVGKRVVEHSSNQLLREYLREERALSRKAPGLSSLSIAICTKDRPELLGRCLDSLQSMEHSPQASPVPFEILVIDNAPSNESTRHLASSFGNVRYVREERPGLNFARNRALREATGKLLAFLDDDVTVDRWWFHGLQEAVAENPDAAAVTGLVLPYELATRAQVAFEQRGGFRRGFDKQRFGREMPGNHLYPCGAGIFGTGANMAFRRDVLFALGGFDEALDTGARLPGGGDLDIFYRLIRAGHVLVYEPMYMVFHRHRREMGALRRQFKSWGLGLMAFVAKCYRTDPLYRSKLRWLIAWWFRNEWRELRKSRSMSYAVTSDMIFAELWGGIVGLLGEYSRSSRRIERIRKEFP